MTSMTENIVIELDRQNSLLVQSDGIEAENKSSWINMISPIDLKVGDNISLQNSIINIRGANSESIEITGEQIKGSKFTDNFVLLHSYLITYEGAKKLLSQIPINMPLDSWISSKSRKINIYRHNLAKNQSWRPSSLLIRQQRDAKQIVNTNNYFK